MRIIDKIEINYFRSVYSVTLSKLNDINTLIGENDAGKSNILKALNLFFNNTTEIDSPYSFYDDLSRIREKEVKTSKGRATIWIKTTFNNYRDWESLPSSFSVKKSWNRYSATPDVKFPNDIPTSTVSKFLNTIKFHYIPAVRSRDIFRYYLNLLHDTLIDDEKAGISESSQSLMDKINENTQSMSEKIKKELELDSTIDVPKDLRVLFSALDFATKHNDYNIPLQKRGDGLQTRHIPYILDFVARQSKVHHIWAYEEPENSLELGKAYELANQFKSDFSKENQIFLTTHSPAFYDISGDHVERFLIDQTGTSKGGDVTSKATPISSLSEMDSCLGTAAFVASRMKDVVQELNEFKETNTLLNQRLKESNLPQVVVEGPTDKIIFEKASQVLFPGEAYCEFVAANCASKLRAYLESCNHISKASPMPVIGIFDNDMAGRKSFEKFKGYHNVPGSDGKVINKVKKIFAFLLPINSEIAEIQKTVTQSIHGKFNLSIPIEFFFPQHIVNEAVRSGVLILNDIISSAQNKDSTIEINFTEQYTEHIPDQYQYIAMNIDESSKENFANWICQQDDDYFECFRDMLSIARTICLNAINNQ